jgi:hypothetical protein
VNTFILWYTWLVSIKGYDTSLHGWYRTAFRKCCNVLISSYSTSLSHKRSFSSVTSLFQQYQYGGLHTCGLLPCWLNVIDIANFMYLITRIKIDNWLIVKLIIIYFNIFIHMYFKVAKENVNNVTFKFTTYAWLFLYISGLWRLGRITALL